MDVVFKDLLGPECWVFFDDLTVFSKTSKEPDQSLNNILQKLEKANLRPDP